MPLVQLDIEPVTGALPRHVAEFLADADARIDDFFEEQRRARKLGYFPSDHDQVYRTLRALRLLDPEGRQMCEWGSGFGVIAGLGALLGYEARGIEIDPRLILASRRLLGHHGLHVPILRGSFVPEDYTRSEQRSDHDTNTILAAGAVDEVDVEVSDFDVIFAYPWPTEHELYHDIFVQFADYNAVLVTYSGAEGVRVYRKIGEAKDESDPPPFDDDITRDEDEDDNDREDFDLDEFWAR